MTDAEWNALSKRCDDILAVYPGSKRYRVGYKDTFGDHQRFVRADSSRQAMSRVMRNLPHSDDLDLISAIVWGD